MRRNGKIEYSGPFFEKDVRRTFRQNVRAFLQALVDDGASMARSDLTPGHGRLTGRLSEHIEGKVTSRSGKQWQLNAVVRSRLNDVMPGHRGYATAVETGNNSRRGVPIHGRATWTFKRVGAALRRNRKAYSTDLTKGLN